MAEYLGGFSGKGDVEKEFKVAIGEDIEIAIAAYGFGDYEGSAFVLYEQGGKLYEVNGSHCSCFGLEGQWEPEETDRESLRHRMEKGTLGRVDDADFTVQLAAFLGEKGVAGC